MKEYVIKKNFHALLGSMVLCVAILAKSFLGTGNEYDETRRAITHAKVTEASIETMTGFTDNQINKINQQTDPKKLSVAGLTGEYREVVAYRLGHKHDKQVIQSAQMRYQFKIMMATACVFYQFICIFMIFKGVDGQGRRGRPRKSQRK